jgi:hypothetical protein
VRSLEGLAVARGVDARGDGGDRALRAGARASRRRTGGRARRLLRAGGMASALAGGLACAALGRWREPEHAWFRFYPGPMRELAEVAVLCKESRETDVRSIRRSGDSSAWPARHERWQFPECIEAPPGSYVLEVSFFSRDTHFESTATITETMESAVPNTVTWSAEAGGAYVLRAVLGGMAPLPGLEPRAPRESATTEGRWYLRAWKVEIERVASWDALGVPALAYREAWRRYDP